MQEDLGVVLSTFQMNSIQYSSRISNVREHIFIFITILLCPLHSILPRHFQLIIDIPFSIITLRQLRVDLPSAAIDHELELILVLAVDDRQGYSH